MAVSVERLYRGTATSSGFVYTCPSGVKAVVSNLVFCNTSTGSQSLTVSLGGVVFWSNVLPPKSTVTVDLRQVLAPGETLACVGASSVTVHASGSVVS